MRLKRVSITDPEYRLVKYLRKRVPKLQELVLRGTLFDKSGIPLVSLTVEGFERLILLDVEHLFLKKVRIVEGRRGVTVVGEGGGLFIVRATLP